MVSLAAAAGLTWTAFQRATNELTWDGVKAEKITEDFRKYRDVNEGQVWGRALRTVLISCVEIENLHRAFLFSFGWCPERPEQREEAGGAISCCLSSGWLTARFICGWHGVLPSVLLAARVWIPARGSWQRQLTVIKINFLSETLPWRLTVASLFPIVMFQLMVPLFTRTRWWRCWGQQTGSVPLRDTTVCLSLHKLRTKHRSLIYNQ